MNKDWVQHGVQVSGVMKIKAFFYITETKTKRCNTWHSQSKRKNKLKIR